MKLIPELSGLLMARNEDILGESEDESINEVSSKSRRQKQRHRTIWISDVHLGTKDCKAEFLIEFLKWNDCDTLYLVGDIIDGWRLKSKLYWPQAHTNVVRRVLTKSKRGTKVVFVTGNHDEFLRKYSNLDLGNIYLVDEYTHKTADDKQLLVIHGDQFDGVTACHKWLAFLGDIGYQLLLKLNRWFNKFRAQVGYGYWSLSAHIKDKVKKAVSFIFEFENAVSHECRRRNYDGVVCGHIHHAEIKEINGVQYHNCGDWVESCTALVEDYEGKIEIVHWFNIDHDSSTRIAELEAESELEENAALSPSP